MRDKRLNAEIEDLIRASMKMTDAPAPELNLRLKAALYQQEAVLRKQPAAHTLSLWYLPMIVSAAVMKRMTRRLLAMLLAALMMVENRYVSYLAAGVCCYAGVAGILLTIVGVKRANIREDFTIRIAKRGVLA